MDARITRLANIANPTVWACSTVGNHSGTEGCSTHACTSQVCVASFHDVQARYFTAGYFTPAGNASSTVNLLKKCARLLTCSIFSSARR